MKGDGVVSTVIKNNNLKNILGELIMYQDRELDRLKKFRKEATLGIIAFETEDDIKRLEERQSEYKNLFRSIEIK